MRFANRDEAGRVLASRLDIQSSEDVVVVVVGLPRGGVPVGCAVATALGAPLDVLVVRKLGVPGRPELGMGAIAEDGTRVVNQELMRAASVPPSAWEAVEARERSELHRRLQRLRRSRPRVPLRGRTVVVVDDGIATGSTARAACLAVRAAGARKVVLATPVAPRETVAALRHVADQVVCVETPDILRAVSEWYDDFSPVSEDTVVRLLDAAAAMAPGHDDDVTVELG